MTANNEASNPLNKIKLEDLKEELNKIDVDELRKLLISTNQLGVNKLREFLDNKIIYIVILCILRLILLGIGGYFLYIYICILNDYVALLTLVLFFIIIAETIYLCVWNEGRDFYWGSISMAAFCIFGIVIIWNAVKRIFVRLGLNPCSSRANLSAVNLDDLTSRFQRCSGIYATSDVCQLFYLIYACYLIVLVVVKIATPYSKRMKLKDHSSLAAALISLSCDAFDYLTTMDIIDVFGPEAVFNRFHTFQVLLTFATLQFSLNLTATKDLTLNKELNFFFYWFEFLVCTEVWSLLVVLLTQELPVFIVRAVTLGVLGFFSNASIRFYLFKNAVMIVIILYKILANFFEYKTLRDSLEKVKDGEIQKDDEAIEQSNADDDGASTSDNGEKKKATNRFPATNNSNKK